MLCFFPDKLAKAKEQLKKSGFPGMKGKKQVSNNTNLSNLKGTRFFKNKIPSFLFVYWFSLNLLKQFSYARGSKHQSFQNHKTAGINKEFDFIGGRR